MVARTAEVCFMPLTVGGGVRSADDARALLLAGADKVAVNSAAVARPELRSEEHTSELQSLMRITYAVFCLKKKKQYPTPQKKTTAAARNVTTESNLRPY